MLKIWHLKAGVQKLFSLLPGGTGLNHLMQKYVTKGLQLDDEHLGYKLTHAGDHYRYFRQYGGLGSTLAPDRATLLELGTGWYPVVPVCFYLVGFSRVHSYDINPWLTKASLRECLHRLLEVEASGRLYDHFPAEAIDAGRLAALRQLLVDWDDLAFAEILTALRLEVKIEDASQLALPDDSVHFVSSNNTFEHVYPGPLAAILAQLQRVLKPGGTMSHFIDMSDHFAHLDRSISTLNFLRFSRRGWERIDNSIQPQNRWRLSDFKKLYRQLAIPIAAQVVVTVDRPALERVPVHAEFAAYAPEDLATLHAYLISVKPTATA